MMWTWFLSHRNFVIYLKCMLPIVCYMFNSTCISLTWEVHRESLFFSVSYQHLIFQNHLFTIHFNVTPGFPIDNEWSTSLLVYILVVSLFLQYEHNKITRLWFSISMSRKFHEIHLWPAITMFTICAYYFNTLLTKVHNVTLKSQVGWRKTLVHHQTSILLIPCVQTCIEYISHTWFNLRMFQSYHLSP